MSKNDLTAIIFSLITPWYQWNQKRTAHSIFSTHHARVCIETWKDESNKSFIHHLVHSLCPKVLWEKEKTIATDTVSQVKNSNFLKCWMVNENMGVKVKIVAFQRKAWSILLYIWTCGLFVITYNFLRAQNAIKS